MKGMAGTQTSTIADAGTANENRTDGTEYLNIKHIIKPVGLQDPNGGKIECPSGYTTTPTGDCKPKFVDKD